MATDVIALVCSECKRKNYYTKKSKKLQREKLEIKKYCKWCNKRTVHKEAKA
jgi:large subunit ribosomal protein L33